MTPHTPGPWEVFKNGTKWIIFSPVKDATIAVTGGWTDESRSQESANARLLAAAPELLEALEGVEGYLTDYDHYSKVDVDVWVKAALPQLRAALAKTRGEAR